MQYLRRLAFTLSALAAGLSLQAQNFRISVVVSDEASQPISYATVSANNGKGAITDSKGFASFNTDTAGNYRIITRAVGYIPDTSFHKIPSSKPLSVQLKKANYLTGESVISSGRFIQDLNEVAVSMSVAKSSEIQRNNNLGMDEAMNRMSGVAVTDKQANIRGSSGYAYGAGSRVMILVDGLPMLSADANAVQWDNLPIENLEQVEVIKGASSALYGSSALGGVINIRTKLPTDSIGFCRVSTSATFYDKPSGSIIQAPSTTKPTENFNFTFGKKKGKLQYVLGGNLMNNNGYRESDYSRRIRFNTQLRYTLTSRLTIGVAAGASRDSAGLFLFWANPDSGYFPQAGTDSRALYRKANIDPYLTYQANTSSTHTLRGRMYYNENNSLNKAYSATGTVSYGEYNYKKEKGFFGFTKGALNLGAVYIHNTIRSDSMYGNRMSRNAAIYAQLDQGKGRFNYSIGVRYEAFKMETEKWITYPVFRAGANYRLFKATFLRASLGQGYRFPSVAERYITTSSGSVFIFPNKDLQPEHGYSFEFGVRQPFKLKKWVGYVDFAAFKMKYYNMIDFQFSIYSGGAGFKSVNLSEGSQISGIEVSTGATGKVGKTTVSGMVGYTYMNPKNLGYSPLLLMPPEEKFLKYRYQHMLRTDVNVAWNSWNIGANIRYNSFMKRIDPIFNTEIKGVDVFRQNHPNGDLICDFRLSKSLSQKFSLAFILKNAFNRVYMFIPGNLGPTRNFNLQLTYQW